ncbi:MAG: RHS repeat-associated core domain-containing protein [Chloroflexi bacterium]|nr:RHS repeat-associated core domain-containing protein [Chloroflexota bacterium]
MTTTGGSVVHQARFLPFGGSRGWTSAPTTAWLDRGYTGHLHNDGVGLIYMNARYYVPSLGRFASADTIVPDPTNPQQFNRFSYVLNNPLRFNDPSGHSCKDPIDSFEGKTCSKAVQDILKATVTILTTYELILPHGAVVRQTVASHATIMDDSTVLTHNHYGETIDSSYQPIYHDAYDANGTFLARTHNQLQEVGDETTTLAFSAGTFSAPFVDFQEFSGNSFPALSNGDEVAIIDWQKPVVGSTKVVWTTVAYARARSGDVKVLVVDYLVERGASGGGLYMMQNGNPIHIGNTWFISVLSNTTNVAININ